MIYYLKWRQPLECGSSGYRWQTPPALEARGILAGGGAKRSHRKRHDRTTRPERAPDRDWSCCEFRSVVPAGTRTIFFDMSRWLRFAPPPANFRRPSGARNSFAEFASSIPSNRTPKAPPIYARASLMWLGNATCEPAGSMRRVVVRYWRMSSSGVGYSPPIAEISQSRGWECLFHCVSQNNGPDTYCWQGNCSEGIG